MTVAEKLRRAAEAVKEYVAAVEAQRDDESWRCAIGELERLGFSKPTVALAVADLLDNEASLLAGALERPDLHLPLVHARTLMLLAVADSVLAGVEG